MSAAKDQLDSDMKSFRDELDTKICYDVFGGECYINEVELVCIVGQPDDGGVSVEGETGGERFVRNNELSVSAYTFEQIQALRKNYH